MSQYGCFADDRDTDDVQRIMRFKPDTWLDPVKLCENMNRRSKEDLQAAARVLRLSTAGTKAQLVDDICHRLWAGRPGAEPRWLAILDAGKPAAPPPPPPPRARAPAPRGLREASPTRSHASRASSYRERAPAAGLDEVSSRFAAHRIDDRRRDDRRDDHLPDYRRDDRRDDYRPARDFGAADRRLVR